MSAEAIESGWPEIDQELNFSSVLSLAEGRFQEAVRSQRVNLDYEHFQTDRYPEAVGQLGIIMLSEDYELWRQGEAETFQIALPLKTSNERVVNIESPETIRDEDRPFFLLITTDGEAEQRIRIDATNYSTLFTGEQPLIEEFFVKLMTYDVVALHKHRLSKPVDSEN